MSLKKPLLLLSAAALLVWVAVSSTGSESPGTSFIKPLSAPLLIVGHVEQNASIGEISEIAKLPDREFNPVSGVPTFGFSHSDHWLKLRVFNFENREVSRLLEVTNPILNECSLYEIKGRGAHRLYQAGDRFKFDSRPVDHRNFLFPLDIPPNGSKELLLKVSSAGEQLQVPLKLLEPDEWIEKDGTERVLRGLYFGIIIFVLVFNLFLYVIIRERSSLFYVIYIAALLMLQLSLSGFAFEYLWPESHYLANIANPFFASLSIFALIRFTQTFLNLKQFYPRIHMGLHIMGGMVAVNSLLSLVHTPVTFRISVVAINVLALALNVAIIPIVILVVRKNFRPAKYFLVAFLVLVGSVFLFILNNFGVLYSDFYAAYGLQIGSALEVILLSFAIVDKFKLFREEAYERLETINRMKAVANQELEMQVEERTREIRKQKRVVEEQKDEILDSIRYAERIQKSLLPSDSEVKEVLKDHFILFRPRDIVSGDFYWVGETSPAHSWAQGRHLKLFATVDCTGHGVPGAMMSMLGYQALEQCRLEPEIDNPAAALNFINNVIVSALNEKAQEDVLVKDGMDMILCAYSEETKTLSFAGAKSNLYLLRNGEIIEYKGDRLSIGNDYIRSAEEGFQTTTIQLEANDLIYTFTDGLPDQFGGPRNKKLKVKNLLNAISDYAGKEMGIQKTELANFFQTWQGDQEQVDDICLMGIRIS